jgi:hypothetical protein
MSNVTSTVRAKLVTATTPNIYNLSMAVSGTEYSQVLSPSTKKIQIKTRDRSARLRIAFVSGDTNVTWITIEPGSVYFEENLDLSGVTIYLQANKNTQIAEILEWI